MAYYLFKVAVSDEPGVLARVTRHLANWHVDLKGFIVDQAGMQLLTAEVDAARRAFDEAGLLVVVVPVHEVIIEDRPGALSLMCQRLADAGINILTAFGAASATGGRIFIETNDAVRAAPILLQFSSGRPMLRSANEWLRA